MYSQVFWKSHFGYWVETRYIFLISDFADFFLKSLQLIRQIVCAMAFLYNLFRRLTCQMALYCVYTVLEQVYCSKCLIKIHYAAELILKEHSSLCTMISINYDIH